MKELQALDRGSKRPQWQGRQAVHAVAVGRGSACKGKMYEASGAQTSRPLRLGLQSTGMV